MMSNLSTGASFTHEDTILVTGGHGLLGRAIRNALQAQGFERILAPSRAEIDYRDGPATTAYFQREKPTIVFHLASVVFGLLGNMTHQVRAIADSTLLNHNVMMASSETGVRKFFFAGSVASYPFPYTSLPLSEDMLWNGTPHRGEFGYAHAKRHALAYLDLLKTHSDMDYLYGILTNLYGPEDRFDDQHGHVIPSLIRKMYRAKHLGETFRVWGDGAATRDFMHVQDAAAAIVHSMGLISGCANICSGDTVSIRRIVEALTAAADYTGEVIWETDKPVGVPERSISAAILKNAGFRCSYSIDRGIKDTWDWFEANALVARG